MATPGCEQLVSQLLKLKENEAKNAGIDSISWLERDRSNSRSSAEFEKVCELLRQRTGMACKVISQADPPSGPYWTGIYMNWHHNAVVRLSKTWWYSPDLMSLWPRWGHSTTRAIQNE